MPKYTVIHNKKVTTQGGVPVSGILPVTKYDEFVAESAHAAASMAASKWDSEGEFTVVQGSSIVVNIVKEVIFSVVPEVQASR